MCNQTSWLWLEVTQEMRYEKSRPKFRGVRVESAAAATCAILSYCPRSTGVSLAPFLCINLRRWRLHAAGNSTQHRSYFIRRDFAAFDVGLKDLETAENRLFKTRACRDILCAFSGRFAFFQLFSLSPCLPEVCRPVDACAD